MNRYLIAAAALAAALTLTMTTAASGSREVVEAGNLYLADNGGISPSKLPRHGSAPITARLFGEIHAIDGTHPPALQTLSVEVDKTIGIDAVGLPVCRASQIEATSSAAAKRACGDAIVGSGEAEVEVAFPEQTPFSATGPVVLFNGGVKGSTTTVLVHAYVNVPAPTAVVTVAKVTRIHSGRFGLRIDARIPPIAGGSASVTKFALKIGRRFSAEGRQKSFLVAGCPTGSWLTRGSVLFAGGIKLGITHVFPCTPSG